MAETPPGTPLPGLLKWKFVGVLSVLTCGVLSGCAELPIVSEAESWDDSSLEEQQVWLGEHADISFRLIGLNSAWYELGEGKEWIAQRGQVLGAAESQNCRPYSGPYEPHRLSLYLYSQVSDGPRDTNEETTDEPTETPNGQGKADTQRAVQRWANHWLEQGWEVAESESSSATSRYFLRAEHDNGASMTLDTDGDFYSLHIGTECSEHSSVVYRY